MNDPILGLKFSFNRCTLLAMAMLLFVLAGCAGGLSQSFGQVLSVVKPQGVDFRELEYYAFRSKSAYDDPDEIRKTYPNVTRVTTVQPVGVRYFIETDNSRGTQTLSIRGTSGKSNIWEDLEIKLVRDTFLGVWLHRGFRDDSQAVFQDAKPFLRKGKKIHITGHSLGAAIALIVAEYLEKDGYDVSRVVNFGQPKVTSDQSNLLVNNRVVRVIHDSDVVPMLPPPGFPPKYHHIGSEIILRPDQGYVFLDQHDSDRLSIVSFWREFSHFSVKDHEMANYLENIQTKIQDGAKQVPYLLHGE